MDTASFLFSFEFDLSGTALRLLSGGAPEVATRLRKKCLRAPSSLCKMSRACFQMTHRGTTADRAEIGRICGATGNWWSWWQTPDRFRRVADPLVQRPRLAGSPDRYRNLGVSPPTPG